MPCFVCRKHPFASQTARQRLLVCAVGSALDLAHPKAMRLKDGAGGRMFRSVGGNEIAVCVYDATDANKAALEMLHPELTFERFESKAKKLLSFFSKNEGKYVVCGITGLGLVLVYRVDYIDDRLELVVSADLITRRTVVIDVADVEREVCFLGDECVVSVA